MMKDPKKPEYEVFHKARWVCICLFSALLAGAPYLFAQPNNTNSKKAYVLSQDLELEIELIISHMIRAYSVNGKNKIELNMGSDGTAYGVQNYCVESNGAQAGATVTVKSPDAVGSEFFLKNEKNTTLSMEVSITDTLKGNQKKRVAPDGKIDITAGTSSKPCHGTNGSTQLSVKSGKVAEEGKYSTVLTMTFATK